jgi:hypothetical protein
MKYPNQKITMRKLGFIYDAVVGAALGAFIGTYFKDSLELSVGTTAISGGLFGALKNSASRYFTRPYDLIPYQLGKNRLHVAVVNRDGEIVSFRNEGCEGVGGLNYVRLDELQLEERLDIYSTNKNDREKYQREIETCHEQQDIINNAIQREVRDKFR